MRVGVYVGVGRKEGRVVRAPQDDGHHWVVEHIVELLCYVVLAYGIFEGKEEEVLSRCSPEARVRVHAHAGRGVSRSSALQVPAFPKHIDVDVFL